MNSTLLDTSSRLVFRSFFGGNLRQQKINSQTIKPSIKFLTKFLKSCGFPGTRALSLLILFRIIMELTSWRQWGELRKLRDQYVQIHVDDCIAAEAEKQAIDRCLSKETPRTVFWPATGIECPAFSLELRSAPTAILKVQPPICLDYRARNRPQLIKVIILKDIKYKSKNGEFERT